MRIVHVSDSHLVRAGSRHLERVDTRLSLDLVLAKARERPGPDVLVASGDLSDDGSEDSYRHWSSTLGDFAAETGALVVTAKGNHDIGTGYARVLGPGRSVAVRDGFRFISLDTSVPGAGWGRVGPAQLRWLVGVLATDAANGTVVVMHHPPVAARTVLLEGLRLIDRDDFVRALEGSDVRLVLAGHLHHALFDAVLVPDGARSSREIPVAVAPGIANWADPAGDPRIERSYGRAGALDIELTKAGAAGAERRARDTSAAGTNRPRIALLEASTPTSSDRVVDLEAGVVAGIIAEYGP